ncbi:MAG: hypothetical protein ABJD66_02255 [Cellulophaga sp.]|uniref:hypothetical protein n=1 Tax=Cellulophaga sp. TaxID=1972202 RepID=UPI003263FD48
MIDILRLKPTFTNITNWNKKPYSSTGGTRAKKIYIDENDDEYFFKGSKKLKDGTFKYRTEFWSEIISSKIGNWLGFKILDYNIAFDFNNDQQIGCLSKSMVEYSENKLSEGIDYLMGFDSKYNPNTDEYRYTFNFIKQTLNYFELTECEPKFIEMLIFDAIVGNSDRHQENWGFISKFRETMQEIEKEIKTQKNLIGKIIPNFKKFVTKNTLNQRQLEEEQNKKPKKLSLLNQALIVQTNFSPIYDSGCCLGRELLDEKIKKMLNDPQMLEAYLRKGKSEVRYKEGKKIPHFELLEKLNNDYESVFIQVIDKVNKNYDYEMLRDLILNIDSELPKELIKYKLPELRKELMIKLIDLRINKLKKLSE